MTAETKNQTKCMAGMLIYFMKAILCSLDTQSRDAMVFGYFTVKPFLGYDHKRLHKDQKTNVITSRSPSINTEVHLFFLQLH